MATEIKYRIFVGDRPIEELTEQERDEFSARIIERMGKALSDYYSQHPDEYEKI